MTVPQQRTADRTAASGAIDFTVMYATHDAFRRDLSRLAAATAEGRAVTAGVRAGWENFQHQLHVHHTVEDAELWPRVERAVAHRPADLALMREMEEEHARLGPLLEAVDHALSGSSSGSGAGTGDRPPADLPERVRELADVLGAHMRHEEQSALPLIQEVLTPKDWAAFRGGMARAQGPRGAAGYIPWILDGIGAEDRRAFLAAMPAPVAVVNRLFLAGRYRRRDYWGS
ncbi:hemerythrin domain-containing protein [Streptacidiphilus carbonis]|uniref:hemerythrin domain-containing protein n=1 Tax=Streptacidiphilus carbonis TaxID=105422 RepID=UPI0005A6A53A|nr:hemerythrin domain-containing protein [Streptacidiphilus carbonis]